MRDRFQLREHLDFYSVEELAEIVRRNAVKLRVEIADEAAGEIAGRSRGTPRLANNRLRWVRDYALSRADGRISLGVARDALAMQGIDILGLDQQDRKYLETIARVFGGGPVGVEAVAHTMNLCSRHAGRRGRAVSFAERVGRADAPGSEADRRGAGAPRPGVFGGIEPIAAAEALRVAGARSTPPSSAALCIFPLLLG